jgi:Domain of unknown function (DUF4278)
MKLIYRGSTYNYDPAQVKPRRPFPHPEQSAYELIYRGNTYRFDPAIAELASVKPDSYQLIYRGSTYQVNRSKVSRSVPISSNHTLKLKTSNSPILNH